ncbi:hypothetical protein [Cellulosilyticum ruminicola]|uniref:hypothetical protein n=1 Tax=Cellulosilyticum ruminicola TaxID=425254 RepID=UPI0006D07577|nr:hypothetical protein [Cellulosilyticum ruminicola]
MNKIILPLSKPLVRTYLYDAYPLSILAAQNDSYMSWLLSNYIQLNINHDFVEKHDLFLEFYGPQAMDSPFLRTQHLSWKFLSTIDIDLFIYLERALNDQNYFHCIVDEFFIPNTVFYQQRHFMHDCLIYGYDHSLRLFYGLNYNKDQLLENFTIDYDLFKSAIENNFLSPKEAHWADIVRLYKYKDYANYPINYNLIKFLLTEYLNGKNTIDACHRFEIPRPERDYGIKIFDILLEYLDCLIFDKHSDQLDTYFDTRVTNLLLEHKNLMLKRLAYLSNLGIQTNDLFQQYTSTYNLCKTNLNLSIKYNLTFNKKILLRIKDNLQKIKEDDLSILSTLINRL